jgi:putative transposase
MAQKESTTEGGTIIQINEAQIKDHLGEIVRGTVQETLNALLDEEASRLCNAQRYERTEGRKDQRAGTIPVHSRRRRGRWPSRCPN